MNPDQAVAQNQSVVHHRLILPFNKHVLFLTLAFITGVILTALYMNTSAQKSNQKQTVTVTGVGEIKIPADQATIYAGINVSSNTSIDARKKAQKATNEIKKQLFALGVTKEEVNVGEVYVDPPYNSYAKSKGGFSDQIETIPQLTPSPVLGTRIDSLSDPDSYIGRNNIDITMGKNKFNLIEKIGRIIDESPDAVIMSGTIPQYMVKHAKQYLPKAREKALLDAREQVNKIASINSLRVGKVLSIEDESSQKRQQDYNYPNSYYDQYQDILYADIKEKMGTLRTSYLVKYELTSGFFSF